MKKPDVHYIKTTFFLAWKNLVASKKTLVIITLVLALSFLSITFFAAIIDGLGHAFEEKSIATQTGHLTIEASENNIYVENSEALVKKISRLDGVVAVTDRIEKGATIEDSETIMSSQVIFVDTQKERTVSTYLESVIEGEALTKRDVNEVYIGSDLVEKFAPVDDNKKRLSVQAGDIITLRFNNGYSGEFKIKGIYETGSSFSDGNILMTKGAYEYIFGEETDFATSILVKLPDRGYELEYTEKLIELGVRDDINPWYTKISKIKQFTQSLEITNKITGAIGLLTTFATIYIIIFINVMTKRKQIGILKAIGIKKNVVLGSYVIQSLVYGILGVLAGLFIMYLLMLYFASNPLKMPIGDVYPLLDTTKISVACLSIIFASITAGFFPSRKAANDNILEAIFGG